MGCVAIQELTIMLHALKKIVLGIKKRTRVNDSDLHGVNMLFTSPEQSRGFWNTVQSRHERLLLDETFHSKDRYITRTVPP